MHTWLRMHRLATIIAVAGASLLAACGDLLPRSDVEVKATWSSFDEAKSAVDNVRAHETTEAELRAAGFDPYRNPNVELLNYSDILRRFPVAGSVTRLDPGLRECMEAGKSCVGYSVDLRSVHRERHGPFLLDLLGFRRDTQTTGWTFNAIVLVVNGRVVYTLYGGKPAIAEAEKSIEPLGPLQNWSGSGLIR